MNFLFSMVSFLFCFFNSFFSWLKKFSMRGLERELQVFKNLKNQMQQWCLTKFEELKNSLFHHFIFLFEDKLTDYIYPSVDGQISDAIKRWEVWQDMSAVAQEVATDALYEEPEKLDRILQDSIDRAIEKKIAQTFLPSELFSIG